MNELSILRDLVVIFAVAVVVVALLRRAGVPSIAGFILAGMLIGPRSLGLVRQPHEVELLAEVGVVLLLFGIGLELSLERIKRIWRPIVIGGALQVGISVGLVLALARLFGLSWGSAVFLGFVIAVSSTAIVLRGLEARGELDAPHGRLTLGILVFQDLSVVPMMMLIPLLAGSGSGTAGLLWTLFKSAALLAGVLTAARLVVPRLLRAVARTRQRELFLLSVFTVCIGTAWAASAAGVSLALGAFVAGLVVSGSEYRHQALAELIPFREVLSSVFFVSVGMLIVPSELMHGLPRIALLLLGIVFGKALIVFLVGSLMRLPLRVSVLSAAALCQVGEFSFVLSRAAQGTELLPRSLGSDLLAATILSMLITPFALKFGPHLAAGAGKIGALTRLMNVRPAQECEASKEGWSEHVIIAGYGVTGEALARTLRGCSIR
ncbi:MAG: cation:proton antiporter [Candidatus Alcyoniella australis]|nr:cation:proton antiporter [Candidatus Alcyoniella australis]